MPGQVLKYVGSSDIRNEYTDGYAKTLNNISFICLKFYDFLHRPLNDFPNLTHHFCR